MQGLDAQLNQLNMDLSNTITKVNDFSTHLYDTTTETGVKVITFMFYFCCGDVVFERL